MRNPMSSWATGYVLQDIQGLFQKEIQSDMNGWDEI